MESASHPAGAPVEEQFFLGTYERPLDEKRRVMVPIEWRAAESQKFALVVWPQHEAGTCLRVLPVTELRQLLGAVESWANDDEAKRVLKRFIGGNSTFVVADKAGRICIPENMADLAELRSQARLVGGTDKFEIWNPKLHTTAAELDNKQLMKALKRVD